MMHILHVVTPPDFSYTATVGSHGWRRLAPFTFDEASGTLTRVHQLASGEPVLLRINPDTDGLGVEVEGVAALSEAQTEQISRAVRTIFSLDWDLSAVYNAFRDHPRYGWIEREKIGRMLVAPTVWEDLAKTLLTTNTTWSQTINMVARLTALGDRYAEGQYAFPTPQQVAALPLESLAERIRVGYRVGYLHDLVKRIASGALDVEAWRTLPSADLYKAIRNLRGFGDYAAGSMLRLLGHFNRLAIDTECRAAYKRVSGSQTATDAEIRAHYDQFDQWRGLVAWMDVMRE